MKTDSWIPAKSHMPALLALQANQLLAGVQTLTKEEMETAPFACRCV